jgi:hypothetical protein
MDSVQSPHSTRVDRSPSVAIYVNEDTDVKEIFGQQVTRQIHGSVKFEHSSLSPSTPIFTIVVKETNNSDISIL